MRNPFICRFSVALTGTAVAALALLAIHPAHAQFGMEIDSGHFDVDIEFEAGALELAVGNHDALPGEPESFDPADVIFQLQSSADPGVNDEFPRPPGAQFDFLGVPAGAPVWLTASSSAEEGIAPLIGLSAEEIATGVFVDDTLTLRLIGFSGPGEFSLFQGSTPFITTADGFAGDFAEAIASAGHQDYTFAFTQSGLYALTFEASGDLVGGGTATTSATYNFGVNFVNNPAVVPEVSTLPMILGAGLSVLGMVAIRRRVKKR